MHDVLLVLAVFAACVVESVEALTIVLAVGITRGWRSTGRGVVAGLLVLAVVVAVLGPALTVIPLGALRLVVGGLLLVFGLGWLRKAILRASGFKALHDEAAIFARQRDGAEQAARTERGLMGDAYAFTLASPCRPVRSRPPARPPSSRPGSVLVCALVRSPHQR